MCKQRIQLQRLNHYQHLDHIHKDTRVDYQGFREFEALHSQVAPNPPHSVNRRNNSRHPRNNRV